jgi:hypothetical protein
MRALILFCFVLLTACASTDNTAHRAMYEAIAPEYLEAVNEWESNGRLTQDQAELRRETVATWELLTRPNDNP